MHWVWFQIFNEIPSRSTPPYNQQHAGDQVDKYHPEPVVERIEQVDAHHLHQ